MDTGIKELPSETTQLNSDSPNQRRQRQMMIGIIVGVVIVLAILITCLVYLFNPGLTSSETVARIRDIFIILMALVSLLIGFVLVILMIQIARLTNLLENEIKPILDSTNETISNLRGTTKFISDNLVEPVIKLNEFIAVIQRVTDVLHLTKKR
jgi:predicted PurR-regulated permease PerM